LFRFAILLGEGHRGQNLKHGAAIRTQGRAGEDEPFRLDNLISSKWGALLYASDNGKLTTTRYLRILLQ